jgi:capsular polysaccharide transport system permease protein
MSSNFSREQIDSTETRFFSAMRRYGQIIFALLQREQEKRRLAPIESLADVLEPLIFVAVMGVLWAYMNKRNSSPLGDSPVLFIATGFYAKFYWISIARMPRQRVSTPRLRFPVERRFDYILVHLLLTTADYFVLAIVGFGILYIFFTALAIPYNFTAIIEAMFAMLALGYGWGMIGVAVTKYFWPWPYLTSVFNRGMILFSGVFMMVEFVPPPARDIMALNPMFHAIALFRTGFYPNYPKVLLDPTYLLYCSLAAVFIGAVLERITVRYEDA